MMKKLIFLLLITVLASCDREKDPVLCQNSPPVLRFSFKNADSTTVFQAKEVKITYQAKDNIKTEIRDVNFSNGFLRTYDLVLKAHELGNHTSFAVEADGLKIAEVYLKTYQDKTPCDGWIHASEVLAEGKALTLNKANYTYVIDVKK